MSTTLAVLLKERYTQNKPAFRIAVLCGLIAALLVFLFLEGERRRLLDWASPVTVVVAVSDIREMTRVDETMLRIDRVPRKFLQPGALSSIDAVVGQVAMVPIMAGEQVAGTKVATLGDAALALKVPRGLRGLTVAVSDVTGVAGLLRPGNSVDVVGTFDKGDDKASESVTMTLLQNVLVLAVDQRLSGQQRAASARDTDRQTPPRGVPNVGSSSAGGARNVTLAVSPADAQRLVLAQEIGTLTLTLRSAFEAAEAAGIEKLTHDDLLGIKKPLPRRRLPVWRELRSLEQGPFGR